MEVLFRNAGLINLPCSISNKTNKTTLRLFALTVISNFNKFLDILRGALQRHRRRWEPFKPNFLFLFTDAYQVVELKPTADNIANVIGLLLEKKIEYLIEGLNGVMAFTANG